MRLSIETEDGVIFRLEDESALVPSAQDERSMAFEALKRSLSILAGTELSMTKEPGRGSQPEVHPISSRRGYGAVVPFRR